MHILSSVSLPSTPQKRLGACRVYNDYVFLKHGRCGYVLLPAQGLPSFPTTGEEPPRQGCVQTPPGIESPTHQHKADWPRSIHTLFEPLQAQRPERHLLVYGRRCRIPSRRGHSLTRPQRSNIIRRLSLCTLFYKLLAPMKE